MTRNFGIPHASRPSPLAPSPFARRYRRFGWGDLLGTLAAAGMASWFVVEVLFAIAGR